MTLLQKIFSFIAIGFFILWTIFFMDQLDQCRTTTNRGIICGNQPILANIIQYILIQLATTGSALFVSFVIFKKKNENTR